MRMYFSHSENRFARNLYRGNHRSSWSGFGRGTAARRMLYPGSVRGFAGQVEQGHLVANARLAAFRLNPRRAALSHPQIIFRQTAHIAVADSRVARKQKEVAHIENKLRFPTPNPSFVRRLVSLRSPSSFVPRHSPQAVSALARSVGSSQCWLDADRLSGNRKGQRISNPTSSQPLAILLFGAILLH